MGRDVLKHKSRLARHGRRGLRRNARLGGTQRSRAVKKQPIELRLRALIGILVFLYMLKLIDAKSFRRIVKDISPPTKPRKPRRRRSKKRGSAAVKRRRAER